MTLYQPLPPGKYGIVEITNEIGVVTTRDAYLCCHCQMTCIVVPGSGKVRGWCKHCGAPTCGAKACAPDNCFPLEARLEVEEGTRTSWKGREILC